MRKSAQLCTLAVFYLLVSLQPTSNFQSWSYSGSQSTLFILLTGYLHAQSSLYLSIFFVHLRSKGAKSLCSQKGRRNIHALLGNFQLSDAFPFLYYMLRLSGKIKFMHQGTTEYSEALIPVVQSDLYKPGGLLVLSKLTLLISS